MVKEFMGIRSDCWKTRSSLVEPRYDRQFRKEIERFNNNYGINGQEWYILHSNRGYKLSNDLAEIQMDLYRDMAKYKGCLKMINYRIKNSMTLRNEELDI